MDLENLQRELLCVLLGRVLERELISEGTYSAALELLRREKNLPPLLRDPSFPAEEVRGG